jgi:hypothetical protein
VQDFPGKERIICKDAIDGVGKHPGYFGRLVDRIDMDPMASLVHCAYQIWPRILALGVQGLVAN